MAEETWELRLAELAAAFDYPPAPNVATAVRARLAARPVQPEARQPHPARLAWVAAILLVALSLLLAVPQVRAAIVEFFQVGVVRIFTAGPTAEPQVTPARPSPTPLAALLNMAGETTLAAAEAQLGASIPLPTYPPGLGPPDRVFVQDFNGAVVILLWLVPEHPDQVQLALYALRLQGGAFAGKFEVDLIEDATVDGRPAYWVSGTHVLQFVRPDGEFSYEPRRLVSGNVLIWEAGGTTFRLETDRPLDEAIHIAESLR